MPVTKHGATFWTRDEWGARFAPGNRMPGGRVKDKYIVHHSWRPDLPCGITREQERTHMRAMEGYHQGEWGQGMAYDFLVFQSGRGYEGKGWGWVGTHTGGQNTMGLGVCIVINGNSREPTAAVWETLQEIADASVRGGFLVPSYTVGGHRDFAAKDCPGDLVYPLLQAKLAPDGHRSIPILRIGARGFFVELLQRKLGLTQDGIFGPVTEAKVRDLQGQAGLLADGIVGPATWKVMGVPE